MLEPKRYLSPFASQSQYKTLLGGTSPNFGEEVELGRRVWYPVNVLHIMYNLFAGTETLSLSVYEPIAFAIHILFGGPSLNLGVRGGVRGVECGTTRKPITMGIKYFCCLKPTRYRSSFRSHKPCKFLGGGRVPQIGGKGWG